MSNADPVLVYLKNLQDNLCSSLLELDPALQPKEDVWERNEGGGGISRAFSEGQIIEKAGVNFSHVFGAKLPSSATKTRPDLANQPFQALGVSVVFHPRNPYVPTTHMNVRFISTLPTQGKEPIWWFGGGFDLTPYYAFEEDAIAWHKAAREACSPFGADLYPRFKEACDDYFHLPHRDEQRGIGGIFFDDFNILEFEETFAFTIAVAETFMPTWLSIVERRKALEFSERERNFQMYRRGRYVEFNLLFDRGTLFGIQSNGRTESILMSLPPLVKWEYQFPIEPGTPEDVLTKKFLIRRNWI